MMENPAIMMLLALHEPNRVISPSQLTHKYTHTMPSTHTRRQTHARTRTYTYTCTYAHTHTHTHTLEEAKADETEHVCVRA